MNSTEQSDIESQRKVVVTHVEETSVDVSRLDEWIDANYPKGRVQVIDLETTEVLHDGF